MHNSQAANFEYVEPEELEPHPVIKSLLISSKNSAPFFPPSWSKNICESSGLECNEDVFFNLISNVVDFKLDECISFIKENSLSGVSKKQAKQLTIKTIDVENYCNLIDKPIARPRVYPQLQVNQNEDDFMIPIERDLTNGKSKQ